MSRYQLGNKQEKRTSGNVLERITQYIGLREENGINHRKTKWMHSFACVYAKEEHSAISVHLRLQNNVACKGYPWTSEILDALRSDGGHSGKT